LFVVLAATLAVFGLVNGGLESENPKFWIALSTVLFAELVVFGLPVEWVGKDVTKSRAFPFQFTAIPIAAFYLLAVVVLNLIALTTISASWLGVMHISAFVVFALLFIAYLSAGRAVSQDHAHDQASIAGYDEARMWVDRIDLTGSLVPGDRLPYFEGLVRKLKDQVTYMAADVPPSLRGGEALLVQSLQALEATSVRFSQEGPSSDDLAGFESELNAISRLIDVRETSIRMAQ
jgi:hypothetical protein